MKQILYDLTSSKEEFDHLYSTDIIYIVRGYNPDDNNLYVHYNDFKTPILWINKLRGPYKGPAKLGNYENNGDYFHGYIFGINGDDENIFDEELILHALKIGYTFEKISVLDIKDKEQEIQKQHVTKFFEEVI